MNEVYEQLLSEIHRLKGETDIHAIFDEYIYQNLTVAELTQIIKNDHISSINLPPGLSKEPILRLALKMLLSLQSSTTWAEFEQLNKRPPPDPVQFDTLIDHLLNRKPPE